METVTEITAALAQLEALMTEKGIKTPRADYTLKGSELGLMWLASCEDCFDGASYKAFHRCESVQDGIQAAFDYINAMPDPATAERQKWHKDLADVIDRGHAMALPDEVMQPLRQGSQAMTENLLTHEAST